MAIQEAENLETPEKNPDNSPETIAKLRRECSDIIESKNAGQQLSSKEDIEENRRWLNSPDAYNAKKLQAFKIQYPKSVKFDQDKIKEYEAKIQNRVEKGLLSSLSIKEYKQWFLTQKTSKKVEYIEKCDLDDPARVKTKAEFDNLNKYFTNATVRKKFLGSDLQKRRQIVAELKEKKEIIESVAVLPSIVREQLKHACVDAAVDVCKKLVAEAKQKHDDLKAKFLKLPPLVQQEHRERFKSFTLDERKQWLDATEQKIAALNSQYRGKIKKMQQPNQDGLTLFSIVPENAPGSSAKLYMDWFTNKLPLSGMENAVKYSDLDNPKRATLCKQMGTICKTLSMPDKKQAVQNFNAADMTERENLIKHYETRAQKGPQEKQKNAVEKALKRILGSKVYDAIRRKIETFSIVSEIAKRRRLFRLTHHTANDNLQKAISDESLETAKKSAKFKKATTLQDLKGNEAPPHASKVQIKLQTLEAHGDAREQWRRILKPDVDNPHAQLASDIVLKTKSGSEVKDEEIYRRTELEEQLEELQTSVAPIIETEMRTQGQLTTNQQIQRVLKTTDWGARGKEVIKRAA